MVSGITFRSLIYLEFIFVCGLRKYSNLIVLHLAVWLVSYFFDYCSSVISFEARKCETSSDFYVFKGLFFKKEEYVTEVVAHKVYNIYCLALYRESLLTLDWMISTVPLMCNM